jgi:two-component system sensor kinase FixL
MTWITFLWPMVTAACLTMGLIHLWIGLRRKSGAAHLLFAVTAFGVAAFSCLELAMIRADSAAYFLELQRWVDFAGVAVLVSMAAFVWVFFGAGRKWLALGGCGLALAPMILNLGPEPKMIFLQITGIRTVETFGGATYAVAEGTRNLWSLLFYGGVFLIVVFVADASITLWRRRERRRAGLIGGAIIFFLLLGGTQSALVDTGIMATPYLVSFFYLFILVAMGIELSDDVLHAAQLAADLHESEERMNLATQAGGIGLWIWDLGTNQVWGSERWLELFGLGTQPNVAYERVVGRIHPDERDQVEQEVRRALADRTDYIGEFRLIGEDGAERWIGAQARMSPDMNGSPVRMLGAAIDITARKKAEQETQELRQNLAHSGRVTLLGQLASALAHELGQPLGAILRNAEAADLILREEPPDLEELRAIVTDIRLDDHRASDVITRLRSLLKKGELELQPVQMAGVIAEVVALVKADAAERGVKVEVTAAPDLPDVRGDRVHLQQVLLNLIINAMDALRESKVGERRITITAASTADGKVMVSVSDSGPGIEEEKLGKLFEPFFTTKSTGMGLGLAISQNLIEAHHGKLRAENLPEGGAVFHFTVPGVTGGGAA